MIKIRFNPWRRGILRNYERLSNFNSKVIDFCDDSEKWIGLIGSTMLIFLVSIPLTMLFTYIAIWEICKNNTKILFRFIRYEITNKKMATRKG